MKIPNGLTEIEERYGNIYRYIRSDGTLNPDWEREHMTLCILPFTMRLSWEPSIEIARIRCHRLILDPLIEIFDLIHEHDLASELQFFGGCFAYRTKRLTHKLSLHAWGIALDFNPATNQQGTKGSMNPNIVAIFKSYGAVWGGDWEGKSRDPMHFQFASGY